MDSQDPDSDQTGNHAPEEPATSPRRPLRDGDRALLEQVTGELAPDLEVIRPIGRGAMASVYLAREPALKRMVAVKVLSPELSVDPTARRRFEREAQSAAQISHPNVTSVYRVGRLSNDLPYLVMEYVEGRNLADRLAATGPLGSSEARRVVAEVASALAAAHEKGIIHRDVKPGNVMCQRDGERAVLMDFGIAAILASGGESATRLTRTNQRVGDVRYMSPEQLKGEPLTEQADVYGLGMLGYELLAGRHPYVARTTADLAAAHLRQSPIPLKQVRADVDGDLAVLVERCLAKSAAQRPTADEVARVLSAPPGTASGTGRRALGHPSASAPPLPALSSFLSELRRRRVYQVAVGYLAMAFVTLEGADIVLGQLPVPDWIQRTLVTVVVACFPLALVLAWMYDITASGIRKTRAVEGEGAVAGRMSARALAAFQILGLTVSLALAGLIAWWIWGS